MIVQKKKREVFFSLAKRPCAYVCLRALLGYDGKKMGGGGNVHACGHATVRLSEGLMLGFVFWVFGFRV